MNDLLRALALALYALVEWVLVSIMLGRAAAVEEVLEIRDALTADLVHEEMSWN